MADFQVKLYPRAYHDVENIYAYISKNLMAPRTALSLVHDLEKAIISLEKWPERGALRRVGLYGNKGYRQLFVKNYIIIYRIHEIKKEVHIITVVYGARNF